MILPSSPKQSPPTLPLPTNMSSQPCTGAASSALLQSRSQPNHMSPTAQKPSYDISLSAGPTIPVSASITSYVSSFPTPSIDTHNECDDEPVPFVLPKCTYSPSYTQSVFPQQTSHIGGPSIISENDHQLLLDLPPAARLFASDLHRRDRLNGYNSNDGKHGDGSIDDRNEDGDDDDDNGGDCCDDVDHDGGDSVAEENDNGDALINPIGAKFDPVSDSQDGQEPCVLNVSTSYQLHQLFPKRSKPIPIPGMQRKSNRFSYARPVNAVDSNTYSEGDPIHGGNTQHPRLWLLLPASRRQALCLQPTTTQAATSLVVGSPPSAQRQYVEFDERAFY